MNQPGQLTPVIRTTGLTKHYKVGSETIRALDGVSIEIHAGEYVAIMGASGSGKSTLMNILGCLDRPTEGVYELDGHPVNSLSEGEMARIRNRRIGFVFQSFELLPRFSAVRNVELPLLYSDLPWHQRRKLAHDAIDRVALTDRAKHRPNQLSGGQRQRVAIARALVCKPSLLLADEPTGNLDSATSIEILRLVVRLHEQGQTIVIVTHEADVAAHAKRIIRMRDGKVLSDLPVERDELVAPYRAAALAIQQGVGQ